MNMQGPSSFSSKQIKNRLGGVSHVLENFAQVLAAPTYSTDLLLENNFEKEFGYANDELNCI